MDRAEAVARASECMRAAFDLVAADLEALAATIRADNAEMQRRLLAVWLMVAPAAGHA